MVEKKRKPQEIVPLMLRLREALRQRLAKDAEKAAKSLNAEIVDRLEASYTKDERIEELRDRLEEMRQEISASEAKFEKDRAHLEEEAANRQQKIEKIRAEIEKIRAEAAANYTSLQLELERETSRLEASDAVFNALVGEDIPAREALRSIALFLAGNPGWANNPDGIEKVTDAANVAIQAAAKRGAQT
jgi:chromosome segregation ATPase